MINPQKTTNMSSYGSMLISNENNSMCLQSPMPKTILIPIPISKSSAPRFRNSVEGLNQEIERIIIRDTPEKDETIVVSSITG